MSRKKSILLLASAIGVGMVLGVTAFFVGIELEKVNWEVSEYGYVT